VLQVAGDLAFVPGEQDRVGVWKVLVERGTSDAGLLGDLRQRRPDATLDAESAASSLRT